MPRDTTPERIALLEGRLVDVQKALASHAELLASLRATRDKVPPVPLPPAKRLTPVD